MKLKKFLIAGAFTLASFGANAALITSDQNAGDPLPTGGFEFITEIIGDSPFAHSVYFTTDSAGVLGSASAIGLQLAGVSGVGPLTISLYQDTLTSGETSVAGDLVASIVGTNLNNVAVTANTAYSFVIEGTLADGFDQGGLGGSVAVSAVPIPAAAWLFGSGLIGLAGIARRKKAAA